MDLADVVWIGGSPCAGKTSVARILAARHGLTVYPTDALEARAATPTQPMKRHLQSLTPDEVWLRPVAVQVATELDLCREELAVAVTEVARLSAPAGLVVEGTALLPQGVVPLLRRPQQAIWLVPTAQFQRHQYPRRGEWPRDVVRGTSDPARAFELWMERDVRYARIVAATARELDQRVVDVDGRMSVDDLADLVGEHLRVDELGAGGV